LNCRVVVLANPAADAGAAGTSAASEAADPSFSIVRRSIESMRHPLSFRDLSVAQLARLLEQ
jgi:hypothetical protein